MARFIDPSEQTYQGRGRPASYPWDEWLVDGKTVRIVRGEDFECQVSQMRPQAYAAAKRRKGAVTAYAVQEDDGREALDITFHVGAIQLSHGRVVEVEDGPNDLDDNKIVTGQWGPPTLETDLFPQGIRPRRED